MSGEVAQAHILVVELVVKVILTNVGIKLRICINLTLLSCVLGLYAERQIN